MKFLFLVLCGILMSCDKDAVEKDLTLKEQIEEKQEQWASLEGAIKDNYQIQYMNTGFLSDSGVIKLTDVVDGEVAYSTVDIDFAFTVESFFERALELAEIDNESCELQVEFDEKLPMIKSIYQSCHTEGSGIAVKNFMKGNQINLTHELNTDDESFRFIYESLSAEIKDITNGALGSFNNQKSVGGLVCNSVGVVFPGADINHNCWFEKISLDYELIYNSLNSEEGSIDGVFVKEISGLVCTKSDLKYDCKFSSDLKW